MGKINLKRVYHIGIPVNDLERSERFYVDVLGMKVHGPMAFKENGKRTIGSVTIISRGAMN